ncbi:MAG TPA: DUF971 domain-containing protein [Gammaproteobacteria bacterium]
MSLSAPSRIKLRRSSRLLEVHFGENVVYELPFEYLRVFSPSAEVRGHGGTENGLPKILVIGKEDVNVTKIEPVGNYAIRLVFDDGHDSGIYSWPVLRELGENAEDYWRRYLERLKKAGVERASN